MQHQSRRPKARQAAPLCELQAQRLQLQSSSGAFPAEVVAEGLHRVQKEVQRVQRQWILLQPLTVMAPTPWGEHGAQR